MTQEGDNMTYLVILDENNKRITSIVTTIHGDTVEDLHKYADTKEYKDCKRVEMTEDEHNKFLQQEVLDMLPSEEEKEQIKKIKKLQTKEIKLRQTLDEINKEYVTALIDGDEELMEELKAERLELLERGV